MAIGIGLIGTGFMGKAHAMAYRSARAIMGDVPDCRLVALCDTPMANAEKFRDQYGFEEAFDDWRRLVEHPLVEVVSVATPNMLHAEIAIAALENCKHVWCEKPMALTLEDAEAMEAAAKAAGKVTLVGYNYLYNPALLHAKELIAEGHIGEVIHVRGYFDEDYQADPDLPWTWRARVRDAGLGALGDMACHSVSMIHELVGPIESLIADMQTVYPTRALADGSGRAAVENEDAATAVLRFPNGARGLITTSRCAWGRKNRVDIEVHGTKGQISFHGERMNELRVYVNEGPMARQGMTTILTGGAHPPYGNFVPAPGHQIGFLDLKTIEGAELLRAVAEGREARIPFSEALKYERVIHAMAESARNDGKRVTI